MNKLLLLILTGCLLACTHRKQNATIRIATKPMTEQAILGEMLGLLIAEHTGLAVSITQGISGGTGSIHPALVKGDFDLYPEYTGTGWLVVLKKDSMLPPEELYEELKKEYLLKYDLRWIAPYGFSNTYSLAVDTGKAQQYGLAAFSDLARYPDVLSFGAEYDFFEIPQGYDALCDYYGLKFKKATEMNIQSKYNAIESGRTDVINVFTTDGPLSEGWLKVLNDDKNFFPSSYCATVIRQETLSLHPELEKVLMKMKDVLTNREMSELNYLVDVAGKPEREVAACFLKKKGLLNKNKNYGK